MNSSGETICALSTSPGRAGIAVIRMSGSAAESIAIDICSTKPLAGKIRFSRFLDQHGTELDHGLVAFFPSPSSFTGEDVIELYPHGNPHIVNSILDRLCQLGARLARAGEFSERAFIAKKQDLVQLEATADLIAASSARAARNAVKSMRGEFSRYINRLIDGLLSCRVHLEATLDFPDEEIDPRDYQQLAERVDYIIQELDYSIDHANNGIKLQDGISVVLVGKPNVGKSSLLNALAGTDHAIVTNIPGTTRDIVEVSVEIEGIEFNIKDTAGIRDSQDPIEQIGIARARNEATNADIVIQIVDEIDEDRSAEFENAIKVINKIDQLQLEPGCVNQKVYLSALTGAGINHFKKRLLQQVAIDQTGDERPSTARTRHLHCLKNCREYLLKSRDQLITCGEPELAAEELLHAQQALQEITGVISADDLLGRIFSEFCIGK